MGSHDRKEDAALAVTELVNNALQHGRLSESDEILVTVDTAPGRVRVAVRQPGGRMGRQTMSMPPLDAPGGRGLAIVDRLASRWGYAGDTDLEVWFELT